SRNLAAPGVAANCASRLWALPRTLMPKTPAASIARQPVVVRINEMMTRAGATESEQHDVTVTPQGRPSTFDVTSTTPEASVRIVSRKPSETARGGGGPAVAATVVSGLAWM